MPHTNHVFLFHHTTLLLLCATQVLTATAVPPTTSRGFSLELIHRDSVRSPFYTGNVTEAERIERLVQLSIDNVHWLKSSAIRVNITMIRPPVYYQSRLYVVAVNIGTGAAAKDYFLAMDSGSELTWVHCKPCSPCFPGPWTFEPEKSPSYSHLPAADTLCRSPYKPAGQRCTYRILYGDGSYVSGDISGELSRETFSFQSSRKGKFEMIRGLVFGCTHESRMNFNGHPAGIMGMQNHPLSFAMQLAAYTGGRFSYCLFDPFLGESSFLRFGDDIPVKSSMQHTQFVRVPHIGHYYLRLIDISLDNQRLPIKPGTFDIQPDGNGGVFIDSGTILSRLVLPAYELVIDVLMNYFMHYDMRRLPGKHWELDLCYKMPSNFERFMPTMTFHFRGADLRVRWQELFYLGKMEGEMIFCLAILPNNVMTVLGAHQQANTRFVYDLQRQVLLFAPEDCKLDAQG